VNRNGGQQQEPTEVIQRSRNATLNAVEIPLALARGGCQYSTFGDPRMRRLYLNVKKTF